MLTQGNEQAGTGQSRHKSMRVRKFLLVAEGMLAGRGLILVDGH